MEWTMAMCDGERCERDECDERVTGHASICITIKRNELTITAAYTIHLLFLRMPGA
jgi:hypothetical protein